MQCNHRLHNMYALMLSQVHNESAIGGVRTGYIHAPESNRLIFLFLLQYFHFSLRENIVESCDDHIVLYIKKYFA